MSDAGERTADETAWQRLDPRMLVVQPIQELIRFIPVLLGVVVAGRASGGGAWQLLGVLVPVLLGVLRYLSTRYRLAAGRIELRRGLLNRTTLAATVDRVRTVDLTAGPIHRVLGLTTMRIGTGANEDEGFDLDGLPVAEAHRLRTELLRATADTDEGTASPADRAGADTEVLRLDPSWARYAPLTSAGLVVAAGVLGLGFQLLDSLDLLVLNDPRDALRSAPAVAATVVLALGAVVAVSALAVVGYLLTSWDLRITHRGRAWHLRRGALTTRETTLDDERVAGVSIAEPLGLRLAGAATLSAIVTGLGRDQPGSSTLVPPAPYAVVTGLAREVLGADAPLADRLRPHGPQATRRRWSRAVVPAVVLAVAALVVVMRYDAPWWLLAGVPVVLVVAALLARDRARSLGHALIDGHLAARQGSLVRRREVLQTDAVIGWVLRDTWFQRRAGLVTLVATTAGGDQSVAVLDLPAADAVALADAAVPGLLAQFLAPERR